MFLVSLLDPPLLLGAVATEKEAVSLMVAREIKLFIEKQAEKGITIDTSRADEYTDIVLADFKKRRALYAMERVG